MAVSSKTERKESPEVLDSEEIPVSAYRSRPGKRVFLEDGNTDGWIATDLFVEPSR